MRRTRSFINDGSFIKRRRTCDVRDVTNSSHRLRGGYSSNGQPAAAAVTNDHYAYSPVYRVVYTIMRRILL